MKFLENNPYLFSSFNALGKGLIEGRKSPEKYKPV